MFEVDLGPILGRFGPDLGPKMAPKSPPKTTQKRTKKQLKKTTKKTTKMTKKIFPRRQLPAAHRAPLPPTPDPAVNGKRRIQTFFVILKCVLCMLS